MKNRIQSQKSNCLRVNKDGSLPVSIKSSSLHSDLNFNNMKNTNTSAGTYKGENAVTAELASIITLLGMESQRELAKPFASWDEMHQWNQERLQQKKPLTEALNQFRNTLDQKASNLQHIQERYEVQQLQTNSRHEALLTRGTGILVAASTLLMLAGCALVAI